MEMIKQAPGVGDGQGSLVHCNPQGGKESDMTEWLNWMKDYIFCKNFIYLCQVLVAAYGI